MTKKGNKNALKHGIFSKFIAVADDAEMKGMSLDKNNDEVAYARVKLAEATYERDHAKDSETKLKWDYACRHWTEIIINALDKNVNRGQTEAMIFESLIDAIRAANDKQNVRR